MKKEKVSHRIIDKQKNGHTQTYTHTPDYKDTQI